MSVTTTANKIQYTLTTGSQALSVPFYFLDNAHIKAVTVATETLPSITLVLGTDYTLTGAGNPAGGTLTTIATIGNSLAAGSKVVIKRNLPITQPTSYSPNDAFPAKVHEAALDRGIMIAQQSDEQSDRAIRLPEDESGTVVLPSASERANKTIGFDSTGANLAMKTLVGADGILETESIGEDALQGAFRTRAQASVALMKAQSYTNAKTGDRVELQGYYSRGDGGGGLLYVDKADTTTPDNGGTVFVASDGTRLKRVNSQTGDILMFGAKADWNGSSGTDNYSYIVAALNNLKSVKVPIGKFLSSTQTLSVPAGVSFYGEGIGSQIIANHDYSVVAIASNCSISNIRISGYGAPSSPVDGRGGIKIGDGATNFTVDNVMIDNVRCTGISCGSSSSGTISNFVVNTTREHGIYLSASQNILVKNGYVYGSGRLASYFGNGIKIANCSDISVSNVIAEYCYSYGAVIEGYTSGLGLTTKVNLSNISAYGNSGAGNQGLKVVGNVTELQVNGGVFNGDTGIQIDSAISEIPTNIRLNGVTAVGQTTNGLRVIKGTSVIITGGYYQGNTGNYSIQFETTSGTCVATSAVTGSTYGVYCYGTKSVANNNTHLGSGVPYGIPGTNAWVGTADSGVIQLYNRYLWIDSAGKVRTSGTAPANPQDTGSGTIVGTQS